MATVISAPDVRHARFLALKVLARALCESRGSASYVELRGT